MYIVAGIDVGCGSTKALLLDEERKVLGKGLARTVANFPQVAREALDAALKEAGTKEEDINYIATTGLGRYAIPFRDIQITDITSGAKGAAFLFPGTKSVLDIGAQNTRAIKVSDTGRVKVFRTNDKCAAGSGSFVEKAAKYLEVSLEEVGTLSLMSQEPQAISSVCAVLAESEIINHVSAGKKVEDILKGVHSSLADRALSLLKRVGLEEELTLIGGVAKQAGMVEILAEKAKMKVNVSSEPEFVAALGAALLALDRLKKKKSSS